MAACTHLSALPAALICLGLTTHLPIDKPTKRNDGDLVCQRIFGPRSCVAAIAVARRCKVIGIDSCRCMHIASQAAGEQDVSTASITHVTTDPSPILHSCLQSA